MSKTILIIEDNEKHRFILEDMLEDEGYKVETAADGNEVKEKMGEVDSFDLILVDIAVPGFDAVDFIKKHKNPDQILVVSAYINKVRGVLPPERLIKKPFDTNELLERVKATLNR